jgi:hypothetical protein
MNKWYGAQKHANGVFKKPTFVYSSILKHFSQRFYYLVFSIFNNL